VRALRAGVVGLVGVLLVLGLTLARPSVADAAEPRSFVAIRFTSMSPSLPDRAGNVTLTGTVTNTSKVELSNLQAIFWRSLDPIQDSEGMQAALASAANEPLGARVADVYQNIPSESDRTLAPKESTTFSLTLPVAKLDLPPIDAIYLLGIHVRGRLQRGGADVTLGRGRLFAPLVSTPPAQAAQLSSLVVLQSRPSLLGGDLFTDDHLADEISPGGRLTTLLNAAGDADTSFAVDPALIQELQTMRSGYRVRQSDGSTTPGSGRGTAGRWLSEYAQMARDHSGFRLVFGHPDEAALVHAGMFSVVEGGEAAAKAITATAALPLLAMPADGQVDQATMDALAELHPRAIVLDESSTGQSRPLLKGPDGIPVLNTAAATFGGGPGPDPRDSPVQIRQHALAETWLEAETAGPQDTIGRLRVVRTADQARSNGRSIDAPWLKQEPLDQLLDSPASNWSGTYTYAPAARKRELNAVQLAGVGLLVDGYRFLAKLLVRPDDMELDAKAATARSASSSWRSQAEAWQEFVDPQQARLSSIRRDAVQIVATPKVVTSAHSVFFPVTVRNTLPASTDDPLHNAIRVRLRFTSANGQRLTVLPSEEMRDMQIPPAAGVTSNAQVEAKSNGTVRVTVRAVTLDGTPVGPPFPIDVQATQAGTIGWLIAIAAGVVLVGGSALRIRQVARERSASAAEQTAGTGQAAQDPTTAAHSGPDPARPHPAHPDPAHPDPAHPDDPGRRNPPDPSGTHPTNSESLDV
jgi:hypothetical protein